MNHLKGDPMKKHLFVLLLLLPIYLTVFCKNAETLVNKADCTITGHIIPGNAAGRNGPIYVVASTTNDQNNINWTKNSLVLSSYGTFKIKDLVAGKYYLIIHMDENHNQQRDVGEPLGGYDANGDERLDPVTLVGGKTLEIDLAFFSSY